MIGLQSSRWVSESLLMDRAWLSFVFLPASIPSQTFNLISMHRERKKKHILQSWMGLNFTKESCNHRRCIWWHQWNICSCLTLMVGFSSAPRVLEPGTESEVHSTHKRTRTCHIHTNKQSPASLINTVLDYLMHQEKMCEDGENITHHNITKKHSIAAIKLATLLNMEAAFSNC